ncbi:HAD-superfamily phosphatase, subfamily IIIC/FkbH-like domain-containing protein [Lachnospiraceae bacterium XBB2008]|nr:HAD-superfamily phosphatase, subfamily IIIC/FkbH-like domain-containing protein [Lachnospiraceae bacterium XBB2008]
MKKTEVKEYDAIVLVTPDSFGRLYGQYRYYLKYLPVRNVYILGSAKVGELLNDKKSIITRDDDDSRLRFINEDDILPFDRVHTVISEEMKDVLKGRELPRGITGWYYQQFLKLSYAYLCEDEYYLIWDGDTFPCCDFSMFSDSAGGQLSPRPYLDVKREEHAEYFETMGQLIPGLKKVIGPSFISEHMLFKKDFVKEMLESIEHNENLRGNTFWERIIYTVGADRIQASSFSEYETYGTYIALRHSSEYRIREWHSFRLGAEFFDPATISDKDYEWLGRDFTAISFEKNQYVREDHKNLFDNPIYQEKMSAKQMLLVTQEAFKDGYKESWGDDVTSDNSNTTKGVFDSDSDNEQIKDTATEFFFEYGKDKLKYLSDDTWAIYEKKGYDLLTTNADQAYLCFENARFLCTDEQKREELSDIMMDLEASESVSVRKTCFIILSYNNEYLMQCCLESIYSNCAPGSFSVVVFDNASTDGVAKWLRTVRNKDFTLVLSDTNLGFAKGCNEALKHADPEADVFFLNNDTRIPPNALFWMRMGLYESKQVGATGAVQNYSSDQIVDVSFSLPEQYVEYGASRNICMDEPYCEMRKLSGFAMLVSGLVIKSLGGFDEHFSPGYFEDDDLSYRIRQAGYKLILCNNSFIYHVGSQGFARDPKTAELFDTNHKKFIDKWGFDSLNIDCRLDETFDLSKIKLIIWDLDNTFWQGILSEGGCSPIQDNIDLVRRLTDKGLINSICSKNDREQVISVLRSTEYCGIWDEFVFADIDWTSKGSRIKGIIEKMSLRPVNVLFIDDEEFNRREAQYLLPDINVAGPEIISLIVGQIETISHDDPLHSRLENYHILEKKNEAKKNSDSDIAFLVDSDICIQVNDDCYSHLNRIHELINRTNQLNFTKVRLNEKQVEDLLSDKTVDCRIISLNDRYGDYGYIGFYAVEKEKPHRLLHFLFSCRVMGMGVEHYIYDKLGRPLLSDGTKLDFSNDNDPAAWIHESGSTVNPVNVSRKPKILLKGPCDIDGIIPYLQDSFDIELETNFVDDRGIIVAGSNNSMHIYEAYNTDRQILKQTIEDAPFLCDTDFVTFLFDDHYDAVVFSTLSEGHSGIYRHRKNGTSISFESCRVDITDPDNRARLISGEVNAHNVAYNDAVLDDFADKFEFLGPIDPELSVRNLTWIRNKLPEDTTLILLLGSEIEAPDNTEEFEGHAEIYRKLNSRLYDAFAEAENVWLINVTDHITGAGSFEGCTNHFSRRVYLEIAEDIKMILTGETGCNDDTSSAEVIESEYTKPALKFDAIYHDAMIIEQLREMLVKSSLCDPNGVIRSRRNVSTNIGDYIKRLAQIDIELGKAVLKEWRSVNEVKDDFRLISYNIEAGLLPSMIGSLQVMYSPVNTKVGKWLIERSTVGFMTVKDCDTEKCIHSLYDPMHEAYELAGRLYNASMDEFHILGCGLGYLAYQIWIKSDRSVHIYIYEDDATMKDLAYSAGVLSWISDESVTLIDGKNAEDIAIKFINSLNNGQSNHYVSDWKKGIYGCGTGAIIDRFDYNERTRRVFEDNWIINARKNHKKGMRNIDTLKYDYQLHSRDFAVISAGPSLDDSIEFIRDNAGNLNIIAVNTVLKRLFSEKIIPDIVVVLDPLSLLSSHLDGVIEYTDNIPLVAPATASRTFIEAYRGAVYEAPALEEDKGALWNYGGTVSSLGLDVAYFLGAERIYLIGNDLAYSGRVRFAKGIGVHDRSENMDQQIEAKASDGGKVLTNELYNAYRGMLEYQIALHPDVKVVNMALHGAYIEGTHLPDMNFFDKST